MKEQTNELTGPALDWAVAKCEQVEVVPSKVGWLFNAYEHEHLANPYNDGEFQCYRPSTNWSQGGPIIERERITLDSNAIRGQWMAVFYVSDDEPWETRGPTPLIAAMRCYVASRLGEEVDIPEGLV